MAGRSWAISVATAIGVAAVAGAAQLGLGYGLGVISWQVDAVNGTTWINSLTWVTFLAATSTIFGALIADRLTSPTSGSPGGGRSEVLFTVAWRFAIALSAAVGALITVPLVALPSRAPRPDNVAPYFTTGGYAIAGVIIGLLVALGALYVRAVATNVIASAAWLWTLAAVAVTDVVRSGGEVAGSAQLGTWQFTNATWVRGMVNLPGALLMLAIALIIGGLAAWPAGRRGDSRVGVAVAGAAGPVLVATAYFLAAPVRGDDQHLSAFVMAPYAVLAGLAGSVLVSAIGPKGARTQARARRRVESADRTAKDAAAYTDWTQALAQAEKISERREAERPTEHEKDYEKEFGSAPEKTDETVRLEEPTYAGVPTGGDSAKDLDEDAYAPSRAYSPPGPHPSSRAYAEDTVEPEPVSAPAPKAAGPATGRAAVKEPLWPTQTTEPTPAPKPRGRIRRGKAGPPDDAEKS